MPLKFAFTDRTTTIVVHERGKYVCPRHFPAPTAQACPVQHENWAKGGCTAMLPTCAGARLRYQLDRERAEYKAIYKQRTADERINSQALALGIERPHLRRPSAIVNQNTLIYVLINLRALQRIRIHQEQRAQQSPAPGRAQPGAAHWTIAAATDRTKLSGTVLFTRPAATNCTLSGPLLA